MGHERQSVSQLATSAASTAPQQPTAELYVRWLQATVFSSHIRVHGIGEREPWAFGAEAEAICRKWLAFRYRLIPYLESVIATRDATGLPVMRAMPLAFPGNALVRDYETQFMCGDALLVAPIVREGGEVEIALPPGGWYDLNTRQRFAGRQVLRYRAKLDQFPGVRARRLRAAARPRGPAHGRDRRRRSRSSCCGCSASPPRPLAGFAQVRIDAAGDGTLRDPRRRPASRWSCGATPRASRSATL